MATLKNLTHQQEFATELHGWVESTQEIAILRMQQVRQSVLITRTYMEGIIAVFKEVRRSYQTEIQKIIEKRGRAGWSQALKKKRAISILLSPSGKFSGPLIKHVFSEFEAYVKKTASDVVVVGETGRELVALQLGKRMPFQYFSVNLDRPTHEQVSELFSHILGYENITVFTGKFQNLVTQVPTAFNISGYDSLRQQTGSTEQPRSFLFEPALEQIVAFFDTQVTASLFRETLAESKLASLGSRIMTLEASRGGITQEISRLAKQTYRINRRLENRKQSNRLSGMRLWR